MPNKKKPLKERLSALRALLLIAAVVFAALLAVVGLYTLGSMNPVENGEENNPSYDVFDSFDKLSYLFEEGKVSEPENVTLKKLTLEEAFAGYKPRAAYYQEGTVARINGATRTTQKKQILRDGNRCNIKTFEGGNLIETIVCDGKNILVRNEITGMESRLSLSEAFTPFELASIPDHDKISELYEDFLAAKSDKKKSEVDIDLFLLRALDMNMLLINISYNDTGVTEKYYYYLDYGTVYLCDTSVDGKTTYSFTTNSFEADMTDLIKEDSFKID